MKAYEYIGCYFGGGDDCWTDVFIETLNFTQSSDAAVIYSMETYSDCSYNPILIESKIDLR